MGSSTNSLHDSEKEFRKLESNFYSVILIFVFLSLVYLFFSIIASSDHDIRSLIQPQASTIERFFRFLSIFFTLSLLSYYRRNFIKNVKYFRISFWIFVLSCFLDFLFSFIGLLLYFELAGAGKNDAFPTGSFDFVVILFRVLFVSAILYFGYKSIKRTDIKKINTIILLETIVVWIFYIALLLHYNKF